MADINLDELLPEDKTISFTAKNEKDSSGKKKKYELQLYIGFGAGIFIAENIKRLSEIMPSGGRIPKINKENIDLVLRIVELVFKEQHEHMDKEWLKKNISATHLIIIMIQLVKPIYEYINNMSLTVETE